MDQTHKPKSTFEREWDSWDSNQRLDYMKKYNALLEEEETIAARLRCMQTKQHEHAQQTKLESAIEQVCNVGSGMIIAFAIMELVLAPALGIGITPMQNVWTTIVLTVVSVLRGYVWRRVFNKRMYRDWANWLKRKFK